MNLYLGFFLIFNNNFSQNVKLTSQIILYNLFKRRGKKLYYFEYNSTLEVDFIIKYQGKITAVEVKAADNTKSKSLGSLIDNWHLEQGIKLSSKNVGSTRDKVTNLPLDMSMFL